MELWPRLLLNFLLEVWSKFPSFLSTSWPNFIARKEREKLQNFNLVPCLNPWKIYPRILFQSIESCNKEERNNKEERKALVERFGEKGSSWLHFFLGFEGIKLRNLLFFLIFLFWWIYDLIMEGLRKISWFWEVDWIFQLWVIIFQPWDENF